MHDLTKWLTDEDIMMVAVKHEISESYVEKLLKGARGLESKPGGRPGKVDRKAVIKDLELLACENIAWRSYKEILIAA